MAEQVEYELTLKDLMTGKLKEADSVANKLESTMGSLGNRITHVAEAFGVSFAIFKGIEFIHSSTEAYEKLEFSQSQVEAGLRSTGEAAGLTFEELKKSAEESAHKMKYTQAEIMGMQSILLTFPSVTKDTFGTASQAIADMSTRLGQSLESSAIQVGKALQDPTRGITALRRVGVNFNEVQTEMVKRMVATGHQAQAQAFILKELQTEFAESAEAAAKADVTFRFNKSIEELQVGLGEAADKLLSYVTPALEGFVDLLKDTHKFMKELPKMFNDNKTAIEMLAGAVAGGTLGWIAYTTWTGRAAIANGVMTAVSVIETGVLYALGTAVEFINAMFLASPIGWIVLGFAAVVTAVVWAWNTFEGFRGVLVGVWEWIQTFGSLLGEFFHGLGVAISNVFNPAKAREGLDEMERVFETGGRRLGEAFERGKAQGINDFRLEQDEKNNPGFVKKPEDANKPKKPTANSTIITTEAKGAKGQKNITITVNISNLVKELKISTTNMLESSAKIREMVTEALTSAVNDSQRVAGQ